MYENGYVPPILTVDSIIFQLIENTLNVLLIERQREPFKGYWALPGGYNAAGETTREAMSRVLEAKGGIPVSKLALIEQLYTFDTVARDPRGHAVSVSYMGLGRGLTPQLGNTTQHPRFFPVPHLPKLAYDHAAIISYAHERLRSKLEHTTTCVALLPEAFTLTELQSAYEAVLGHEFDKRNFRKKFLSLDMIEETGDSRREGAHRPARLYRFKSKTIERLVHNFD